MAVPQYQVLLFTDVGHKGTLLRIRPTLQDILTFLCGTVITVPYAYVYGIAPALQVHQTNSSVSGANR